MTIQKEHYSLRIGRHFLQKVSVSQLKMIHGLIHDFCTREGQIPPAYASVTSEIPSPNTIFITKDTCFDSRTRDFQTEYSIRIGNDALSDISDKDLMNLYFTLRSFLIHSEGLPVEYVQDSHAPSAKEKELSIEIFQETIDDYLIQPCNYSPYVFKRIWNTDHFPRPNSEYGLSTENGTIWDMSRQQLAALQKKIGDLLNYPDNEGG